MEKEISIRIRIDKRGAVGLLAGILLAAGAADLGSETITLDTYYPAPYGIYTELRATGQTTLAESAGGVGIGLGAGLAPDAAYKLDVLGNAYVEGELYTKKLYDQDDPGYYVNPKGNSIMESISGLCTWRTYANAGYTGCAGGERVLSLDENGGEECYPNSSADGARNICINTTGRMLCCKITE